MLIERKTHIICTTAQMIVAIELMQIPFNAYYNEKLFGALLFAKFYHYITMHR